MYILYFIIIIIILIIIYRKKIFSNNNFTNNTIDNLSDSINELGKIVNNFIENNDLTLNKLDLNNYIKVKNNDGDYEFKIVEPIEPGIIVSTNQMLIPDGWVECNGSWYLKSIYKYNNITNLTLESKTKPDIEYIDFYIKTPDLSHLFIKGGNLNDSSIISGQEKLDDSNLPNHVHFFYSLFPTNGLEDITKFYNYSVNEIKGFTKIYTNAKFISPSSTTEKFTTSDKVVELKPKYCILKYIMKI
jgi:hypothetical protein